MVCQASWRGSYHIYKPILNSSRSDIKVILAGIRFQSLGPCILNDDQSNIVWCLALHILGFDSLGSFAVIPLLLGSLN